MVGGDFNASCRARVGYVGSDTTRRADAGLQEWCRSAGLSCAAPMHATWQSVNESRYAVLDSFFWRSKTDQLSITDTESFRPPDPRLDHELARRRGPGGALRALSEEGCPGATWSEECAGQPLSGPEGATGSARSAASARI